MSPKVVSVRSSISQDNLVLPAFTPTIAWDVFRRPRLGHSDDFILVRTTWRSDLDSEKVRTPVERLRHSRPLQPTIELNLLSVPSAELEQLSKELAELKLPIGAASHSYGIDGTFYEIAIDQSSVYSSSAKCRLSWWHTPPAQWPGVYSADVGSEFRKSRGTGFRKVAAACHEQLFS